MCIIVYKKTDVEPPSQEMLSNCWDNNDDGAGYMVRLGDKILLKKGLMSKSELLEETEYLAKRYPNCEYAIHFRIGTSGTWDRECTHPFPITQNVKKLKKCFQYSKGAVMHNGILGKGEGTLSDSQVFVRDVIANCYNMLYKKNIRNMLEALTKGNRLLIMLPNETIQTGTWVKHEGLFFSNSTYEKKEYVIFNHSNYRKWNFPTKYDYTKTVLLEPVKEEKKDVLLCDFCEEELILNGKNYYCPECFNEYCPDCGKLISPLLEDCCECKLDMFDYKDF